MIQESRSMRVFLVAFAMPLALVLVYLGMRTAISNFLGWFLIFIGSSTILGQFVTLWISKRTTGVIREESGDRSFWLILPGFLVVFFASPLEYLFLPAWLPRGITVQIAGLVLNALGLLLVLWTRRALRTLYTGHVQIQAEHRLVTHGPYGWVRHPAYAGFVLMALGLSVGYSSLLGLIAIPALLLPGMVYRMMVEERLLEEGFGKQYREYAQHTKRIIPGVW